MKKTLSHILARELKVNETSVKTALKEAKKEMAGNEKKETMVGYVKRIQLNEKILKQPETTVQKVKELGKE